MAVYTQTQVIFVPPGEAPRVDMVLFPSGDNRVYHLPGTATRIALAPNMYTNTTEANVTQSVPDLHQVEFSIPFVKPFGVNHTSHPIGYSIGNVRGAQVNILTGSGHSGMGWPGRPGFFIPTRIAYYNIDTFDAQGSKIKNRFGFRFSGKPVSGAFAPFTYKPTAHTVNVNLWVYRVPFEQSYHQVNGIWRFK